MQFLLIISHDDAFRPDERLVADIGGWIARAEDLGVRVLGKPLRPASEAMTVTVRDCHTAVHAGPPSRAGEQVCAFELIDCNSMDDAVQLAAAHPMAAAATIEVRPVWQTMEIGAGNGG
jgi:hypothetical protein